MNTREAADRLYIPGMPVEEIMDMWGISERDVLVCCWYEVRHGKSRRLKKAWREWVGEAGSALWSERGLLPRRPPTREEV